MRKLKSISQFESENKDHLTESKMSLTKGGSLGGNAGSSTRINGSTAATEPNGTTDCWTELYDDFGQTILHVITF